MADAANAASPPMKISFNDLTYTINHDKKAPKTILKHVSASFEPGTLTAIMGATGAGKTVMLNAMAGRLKKKGSARLDGQVLVNGAPMKRKVFEHFSAYVMQDDILMPMLTVREQIRYHADLRLKDLTDDERSHIVTQLVKELGLDACANTAVGLPGVVQGVSGGERKRCAIACEVVHRPQVVFLDEPTTGLDSETAVTVIEMLHAMAQSGKTIAATIHQPSSEIFSLIDNLLLLSQGEIVYFGPAKDAVTYFATLGHPCPLYSNPADHIMRVLAEARSEQPQSARHAHAYLAAHWRDSVEAKGMAQADTPPPVIVTKEMMRRAAPFHVQFSVLFHRAWRNYVRDRRHTVDNIATAVVLSLIVGLIFLRLGHDQAGIQNRAGVLFFLAVFSAFSALNSALFMFPEERPVFMREYAKNMYGVAAYFLAKTLAELPLQLICPFISACIAYYMVGLHSAFTHFLLFIAFSEVLTCAIIGIGLAVGAVTSDSNMASMIGPFILMPMNIFGGLFINSGNAPKYFIWIERTSVIRYAYHGLMINEFSGQSFHCKPEQLVGLNNTECPLTTGAEVLDSYSIKLDVWSNMLILLGLSLFIRLVAFLCLVIFARRHRASA